MWKYIHFIKRGLNVSRKIIAQEFKNILNLILSLFSDKKKVLELQDNIILLQPEGSLNVEYIKDYPFFYLGTS
ncbi:hypothetical protein J15TS10_38760 [Paenibacillus woosongensis]|uniref:Uncharacterized protein n=1 Tax=Paenibacillus woosongensis TaxID=307580 RepID=A0ABQ4MVW5_9BACL|nr:hypothetical protein J15TS10_38760 [Paenibacillus woosongensis]